MSSIGTFSPEQAKRVSGWINDLNSRYSCELAPSEPSSFRQALSQIGSSHRAVSSRDSIPSEPRPTHSGVREPPAHGSDTVKPSSKKPSSRHKSAASNSQSKHSTSNTTSRHGSSAELTPTNPPSRPAASKVSSKHSSSVRSRHSANAVGLDPYSEALNEKLSHEHRQLEDRAAEFVKRRPGESGVQYDSRIQGHVRQLDEKLEDLDLRWKMLVVEKEAGLRT